MNRPLRVLAIHNYYRQPGGEDQVFAAETRLLEANGDEVIRYTAHNDLVNRLNAVDLAIKTVWNAQTYRDIGKIIQDKAPDIVHAHNTFPLISPAALSAAKQSGIPVVQTLHNYRLLCANGLLARNGHICEDCVGKAIPWPAVVHKCYRGSVAASAVTATTLQYHRLRRTWHRDVDVFVALTEFARNKFIQGGLPASKLVVKPNFVDWTPAGPPSGSGLARECMLFIGRLSEEKGIRTLLAAWNAGSGLPPLCIVGDGPLRDEVQRAAAANPTIRWLGYQPASKIQALLTSARALILPSESYEMFPLVLLEAFSTGTPVIASRIGALAAIVEDGKTGLHFTPADRMDLLAKVSWASAHADGMASMGEKAKAVYQQDYTPAVNYRLLRRVYALAGAVAGRSCATDNGVGHREDILR